jgi:2-phospho-L-lactate guanylyltransferase
VLVLPADLALLSAADIDALVAALPEFGPGLVLAPDRHGSGTNALLARPAGVVGHHFGHGSFEAHSAAARDLSIACVVVETPGLALDVDSQDDLELIPPQVLAALIRRPCEPA